MTLSQVIQNVDEIKPNAFSNDTKTAWINETDGEYIELLSGRVLQPIGVNIPAYGFYYMKKIN